MNHKQNNEHHEGINLGDIYFVIFRQKWIILAFSAVGLLAATTLFIIKPAQYESEAKLYIQYVMDEVSPKQTGDDSVMKQTDAGGNNIILTELEILTSLDLAQQVVQSMGADKILAKAGGGNDTNAAAGLIVKNLIPDQYPKGSVIRIVFQHPDGDIARKVLYGVIDAYITKSAELHRPVGISDEYLTTETKRLREDLEETDKELKTAMDKAGVVSSLEDTRKAWAERIQDIRQKLLDSESQLAVHRAALGEADKGGPVTTNITITTAEIPDATLLEYRTTCRILAELSEKYEHEHIGRPLDSPILTDIQKELADNRNVKKKLEEQYPKLSSLSVPVPGPAGQAQAPLVDVDAERLQVRKLEAQTNFLNGELSEIHKEQETVGVAEPSINELNNRKKVQEANLNHFLERLVQVQINGTDKYSGGIKIASSPTPAVKKRSKQFKKMVAMALAGGVFGGLGLAFLIEMVLDHTVKRPSEIETKLHLPVFISIPDINGSSHRQAIPMRNKAPLLLEAKAGAEPLLPAVNGSDEEPGMEEIAPWDRRHSLHRYYEGLRDRLIVNFEVRNLTHNPKLVAVTSCGKGAGVSSIAAGLAASLSETGDGNVLLVDMNGEEGAAQQFYKGNPGCGLDDALKNETMGNALVQENLYVATERFGDDNLPRVMPKRFASLMPKLKASDYDYIIFDMPAVSQTSMTPRLAGLMDMVLLVIESEKTNRESVQRATALLAESKANVSTVLNKARSYIPARLHQEFLDDV